MAKHCDAVINLLFGAAFAGTAVLVLVRHWSVVGMALALWFGVLFAALGWLALQGCIDRGWTGASAGAGALSFVFIIKRISRIASGTEIDSTRGNQ